MVMWSWAEIIKVEANHLKVLITLINEVNVARSCTNAPRSCTSYNTICSKCTGKNHFASICRKEKKYVHIVDSEFETNNLFIHFLVSNDNHKSWFKNVIVSLKDIQVNVYFKLDSSAEANILPLHIADFLKLKNVDKAKTVLVSFGDQRIKPEEEFILDCIIKIKARNIK